MLPSRVLAAGIVCLAAGVAMPSLSGNAQEGAAAITCTNPVSNASWQIKVDYAKATVDTYPAKISAGQISWFDPKDLSNNTLDRKTGNLTTSIASSTGGYFRPGRCDLEKSR